MVRTVKHVEDEEPQDSSSPTENKRVDSKGNALRSKHSETEQRRRSKINERFQILRDLIPENDQKRDKASFLLEVIEYIQFLKEKLQMYEGSCQGWSPEPSKLTPWKVSSGPIESIIDQSHLERQFSGHEDNIIFNPSPLNNAQSSIESDLMGASLYKSSDNPHIPTTQGLPLNLGPGFEGVPDQSYQESFAEAEQLIQQSRSHLWRGRSCVNDCSIPAYTPNEEEPRCVNGEASSSSAYSQRLLNSLTNALQSSGVDLSQSNISVQIDLGKRTNSGIAETVFNKEHANPSGVNSLSPGNIDHNYEHHHKRFRADQS